MAQKVRMTDKVSHINEEEELGKRGYVLGITLGEGSYAKVKSAYCKEMNRKVALKIINRVKAPKDFQQRFLPRELDILKRLDHPNVIKLVDIMHFNHKVYIAMEMAGHGDLLEYIKLRGAIPEDKAKVMFQQVTDAIEYLHGIHVIHRDLKCENVLLDTNNNIKISDFGFARIMRGDDVSRTFCGSAAYAAPEILQGMPYSGHAYDIWSIGVILYIMVCGSMPYDDSNIKKMIKYQTERKVGFSKSKNVSPLCKDLIHCMLEADVPTRASIKRVQAHPWLEDAKHPPPKPVPPPPPPRQAAPPQQQQRHDDSSGNTTTVVPFHDEQAPHQQAAAASRGTEEQEEQAKRHQGSGRHKNRKAPPSPRSGAHNPTNGAHTSHLDTPLPGAVQDIEPMDTSAS